MAKQWHISVENLKTQLDEVIERVVEDDDVVIIELASGECITLSAGKPADAVRPNDGPMSPKAYKAFLRAAGAWSDVDTDALVERIYAERRSSKPLVDL